MAEFPNMRIPGNGPDCPDFARQLAELLDDRMQRRRFRRGELLWREGDTTGMLVALQRGQVRIYRLMPRGKAVTLFLFGPGEVFGFLPFFDGRGYPAYAQAIEAVEARVMPRSALLQAIREDPDLAVSLLTLLGERLRAAFDLVATVSGSGAAQRVAAALFALVREEKGVVPELRLPVSQQDFASALHLTPETLSRTLGEFSNQGVLERVAPGRFRVLDLPALRARAGRSAGT